MLLDTVTYLPGDILAKVDRAAMAVSLETRILYLDHHLFSLAWCQLISDRIRGDRSLKRSFGISFPSTFLKSYSIGQKPVLGSPLKFG